MSAIAGIYNLNGEPVSIEQSSGMMKAFEKFPADDIQTWQKESIFLGCHAQWITPESIGEQLPFYDYQRQLAITADAIIDNREELFERLQIDREDRKKITDNQLILLAYHKWGEESPKFLVGDFAFMIWDEKERKMFGARDFSGARTLYYFRDNQRFGFSTTIMPLFSLSGVKKVLNEMWLAEFLAIPDMFYTIDTHSTVYKDIKQVPPSHYISVTKGKVELTRYSFLSGEQKLQLKSNKEYEEAFRDVFKKSVTSRLRTHRQVGSHLSGGLDSGSIVSFAARELRNENKKLHTFSYVPVGDFTDWTPKSRVADERPFIQSTVEYVGNITEHYLSFDGRNPFTEIDEWLEMLEMPYKFFGNSFWMRGIHEVAYSNSIGVLLNGARGNYTISWGSALDYYAVLLKNFQWIHLHHELQQYIQYRAVGRKRIVSIIAKRAFPFINHIFGHKNTYLFPPLLNNELAKKTNVFEKLQEHGIDKTGARIPNTYEARKKQFEQLFYWGNGTSGTKLSLRYSLWNRDPTNDLNVIKFCLNLPDSQFVQKGIDRSLIRRATKSLLPDKVRLNQRYRGVQGADGVHRMDSTWNSFIEELKQLKKDPKVTEYLNITTINNALLKLQSGPRPELVFDVDYKLLMRSLVVHRFIKKLS